jgi:progressive ankylosis protein
MEPTPHSLRRLFAFWMPLSASWMLMGLEGPFLAAVIARIVDPKINLAAYGVAIALGMLVESPIIMMLSAANALVRDRQSFLQLRRFAYGLNGLLTLLMLLLVTPPVMALLTRRVLGLPLDVAQLTGKAMWMLIFWPGAIGYRRLYQGILIAHGLTRRVAYGTAVRLATMSAVAVVLTSLHIWPGAIIGTAALCCGVIAEAAASRFMASSCLRRLALAPASGPPLRLDEIVRFYVPLAATSLLALGIQPLVSLFVSRGRLAVESLAVLPVVNGLAFLFRSAGLAYQEVAIALLDDRPRQRRQLARFAAGLGLGAAGGLGLLAFTPLAHLWFEGLTGLTPALSQLAIPAIRLLVGLPALEVLLAYQRSPLVLARRTPPITRATAIEVSLIVIVLAATVQPLGMVGVLAASLAMVIGRLGANAYLWRYRRPGPEA